MKAAFTPSRRKICANVRMTDVVPAPDEPVIEMIGCLRDIPLPFSAGCGAEQATFAVERRIVRVVVVLLVVALDQLYLVGRPEDERDALVQCVRQDVEDSLPPGARHSPGLLDEEGDRIRLVEQAQPTRLHRVLRVAG